MNKKKETKKIKIKIEGGNETNKKNKRL